MEVCAAAAERLQPVRDARGSGAIVFDPVRLRQADASLLDPGYWGARATRVEEGGRGGAWFVRGEFGEGVLRQYLRGGLAARLSRDTYLWRGTGRTRSVAEFRLLADLRRAGLPVPAPLVAGFWRRGPVYRAAILVERIPDVRSFASWLVGGSSRVAEAPWEAVGVAVARLHRAGVQHRDLNAHNILMDAAGVVWLIDFDRARRREPAPGWRLGNLARLARSLAKLSGDDRWRPGYGRLRSAYLAAYGEGR